MSKRLQPFTVLHIPDEAESEFGEHVEFDIAVMSEVRLCVCILSSSSASETVAFEELEQAVSAAQARLSCMPLRGASLVRLVCRVGVFATMAAKEARLPLRLQSYPAYLIFGLWSFGGFDDVHEFVWGDRELRKRVVPVALSFASDV